MNYNIIEGNPTKQFFIEMITRDISIEDAIMDLVDNSIDGAIRINKDSFHGFKIDIVINEKEFSITDNCGGFSLDSAKNYAFRFGRPEGAPLINNSVGRFGIGMKRALFKIGKEFYVESETEASHFRVKVDVEEWSKKKKNIKTEDNSTIEIDNWDFDYDILHDSTGSTGTKIQVPVLNHDVELLFQDSSFVSNLYHNIQQVLYFSLSKGIVITINGKTLDGCPIEMLKSETYKPYIKSGTIGNVKYRIIAGLGEIGVPTQSGWYIFCNDRLVVAADHSHLTGWGINGLKQWHISNVMFRGIVYLDSYEPKDLPLTTTKKGIDATSYIYQAILPLMRAAMIPILRYLNDVSKMGNDASAYRQMLCETSDRINAVMLKNPIENETGTMAFLSPKLDLESISRKKETVRIAYDVNKKIADSILDKTQASSYKEIGLTSFEYYVKMENLQNE